MPFKLLTISIMAVLSLAAYVYSTGATESQADRRPTAAQPETIVHIEKINLLDFNSNHFYLISNYNSATQLQIKNELADRLDISLSCNKPFTTIYSAISKDTIHIQLKANGATSFLLESQVSLCQLAYKSQKQSAQVEIKKETDEFGWVEAYLNYKEHCDVSNQAASTPPIKLFITESLPQLTCVHQMGPIEILNTPECGFRAKIELLLGQSLPDNFISNLNPYADLDFSKAPHFDAIFVSTLVYRADFYGTVLGRLLKFHAEHGTLVNVITTQYMMLEKDKKLLHGLAADSGNFRLQEFVYYDTNGFSIHPIHYVDAKYRDMHIKLFVTLSKDDPSLNTVIFGGRNIHDGFLFKTLPDHSKYPDLVQYGQGKDDDFVHWNDLEFRSNSREMAKVTFAQLLNFRNRDGYSQKLESFISSIGGQEVSAGQGNARGFMSVPYNNPDLETLYISLIDSAQKSIHLSSPYLRPTSKIMAAIKRAIDRQIEVVIQTRVNLEGDTQAKLYEEVNKESINLLYDKIKIYEWVDHSILHSKFILIDSQVAFVGSVNLSRRSFIQDVENGYIIRDENFVHQLDQVFQSYVQKSRLITQPEERHRMPSFIIKMLQNQF